MTSTEMEAIRVIKFTGDKDSAMTWSKFSTKTKAVGMSKGGWDVALTKDNPLSKDGAGSTLDAKEIATNVRLNRQAWCYLILACEGKAYNIVESTGSENAFEAWAKLLKQYYPTELEQAVKIKTKLEACKMESETSDPSDWFLELDRLNTRLESVDKTLKKKE
jgi:hypothetical protein